MKSLTYRTTPTPVLDLLPSLIAPKTNRPLLRQAILAIVVVVSTLLAVNIALRPLLALKQQLDERSNTDLTPVVNYSSTSELNQMVLALNALMSRIRQLLGQQKRFVADASHQLRTPLAVLKAQIQSGLRGDLAPYTVLEEISVTVERAVNLTNKMLSLAKVEQLRERGYIELCDISSIAQDVVIELSALISEKNIDFSMNTITSKVQGHPWMLFELISNLVHNAIRHAPKNGSIGIDILEEEHRLSLNVWDTGSGLTKDIQDSLFEPFSATHDSKGCGLGLTICAEIARSMNATLHLTNRTENGVVMGVNAILVIPTNMSRATTGSL